LTHLIGERFLEETEKIIQRLTNKQYVFEKIQDAGQKTVKTRFFYGRISKEFLMFLFIFTKGQSE